MITRFTQREATFYKLDYSRGQEVCMFHNCMYRTTLGQMDLSCICVPGIKYCHPHPTPDILRKIFQLYFMFKVVRQIMMNKGFTLIKGI